MVRPQIQGSDKSSGPVCAGAIAPDLRQIQSALRSHAVKDERTPWHVNPDWGYPEDFEAKIDERVTQLELQRSSLTKKYF